MNAPDFAQASREVLAFLHGRLGMALWAVTRTDEDDWVVLSVEDHGYGLAAGDVVRWSDTLCARMVRGDGPRVAPSVAEVPAYAGTPAARGPRSVGAYIGAPLVDASGRLFGTLCGMHPTPMPAALAEELPMVEMLAGMLSGLLSAELQSGTLAREADAARSGLLVDTLTGLANQRGLEHALAAEEERCRRYGATACIVAIELEGARVAASDPAARDARLVRAARALRQTVRKPDTLARLEDDRFVVLGVECTTAEALALLRRLEQGLLSASVPAALGLAMRNRSTSLAETFDRAVVAMEEHRDARARA